VTKFPSILQEFEKGVKLVYEKVPAQQKQEIIMMLALFGIIFLAIQTKTETQWGLGCLIGGTSVSMAGWLTAGAIMTGGGVAVAAVGGGLLLFKYASSKLDYSNYHSVRIDMK